MREIQVSYQPQLADALHAARVCEGETWKTGSRIVAVLLGSLCGVFLYWGFPIVAALWGLLALVEWFNLLPLSTLVAYIEFKRNPEYRDRYDLTLSPEGLRFQTNNIASTLKWNLYARYWETEKAFVLSYGRGVPTVIPKAAFSSPADLEAVKALLSEVIGPSAARGEGAA